MIRALTDNEIHELLEKECYGHLACIEKPKRPYVVPITYVYHENALYSFSFQGTKIDIMRKNPHVCFQVERLREENQWRSAMVWGTFEELSGKERDAAMSRILERLWWESNRDHPIFLPFRNSAETLEKSKHEKNVVLYRILMEEKTGRLEQYE
ncbi:hypothetical protein A3C37_05355 [Candidatus Peribacteria bacterium RIFCSPHIGHO2_02_FULL_53_20]|nr:MAG: hypothetical protein A3C37_05355 [Candidatus Peribacteria bacterium RIFCSPHIGHO2_02_FULL_53_20]OGJ68255.1 MAG: hypothetical protein A3B61_03790 [Candidatus Peribacteria bacterium RIFCSPLOWO2_01_FULL_53_10]OGJ70251.1 MAG: hypothetical protein A3G69_02220 [Candidatus Peribacteria bacterium RIFCSPLOWO2_12_FULL_53_10]